jgi:glutathione synthase/RimK-type ligase-like ATP-grasp enzyme
MVINWGNSTTPTWGKPELNQPEAVALAVNKPSALSKMSEAGVRTVIHTNSRLEALQWLTEGAVVYARTLTRASEGRGIVIARTPDELPNASLYTKGIKDGTEYRLHVFKGSVIDYTKKVPINPDTGADMTVKSHSRGWTFARNVAERESLKAEAIKAVSALGLDFGAVDIIINPEDKNRPYVLEVNSACGLIEGGRTYQNYINAIKNYVSTKNG